MPSTAVIAKSVARTTQIPAPLSQLAGRRRPDRRRRFAPARSRTATCRQSARSSSSRSTDRRWSKSMHPERPSAGTRSRRPARSERHRSPSDRPRAPGRRRPAPPCRAPGGPSSNSAGNCAIDEILVVGPELLDLLPRPDHQQRIADQEPLVSQVAFSARSPRRSPITVKPNRVRNSASTIVLPTSSDVGGHDHLGHADFLRSVGEVVAAQRQRLERKLCRDRLDIVPRRARSIKQMSPAAARCGRSADRTSLANLPAALHRQDIGAGVASRSFRSARVLPTSGEPSVTRTRYSRSARLYSSIQVGETRAARPPSHDRLGG